MNTTVTSRINDSGGQNKVFQRALKLVKFPIMLSFIVTFFRFVVEMIGMNENYIFIIGLLWLTLAFAVLWGIKLSGEERPYLLLLISLIIFSLISRMSVFAAWWVEDKWQLGTHYGLFYDHWLQAFLNHLSYGALVQIIPGFIVGSLTLAIMQHRMTIKN